MSAKGKSKTRMTPAIITAVVTEIKAYGRGERETPLSWSALVSFSGFSKVSMWAKPEIKNAFQQVQRSRRPDATPAVKPRRTVDERIEALESKVKRLRENVRAYDELWALYEYNSHRMGWNPEELRRPLDSVTREVVRSRRRLHSVRH
jgi:hypothetical protein